MKSKPSPVGLAALRNMPEIAREQLFHVVNNANMIIRGIAQQIKDPDATLEFTQQRAGVIIGTVDELTKQLRLMTGK